MLNNRKHVFRTVSATEQRARATLSPTMTMSGTEETISVVVVEDDDRLARLTARYLESHGIVVSIASPARP